MPSDAGHGSGREKSSTAAVGEKKRNKAVRGIPRVRSHPDADIQAFYSYPDTVLPSQFKVRLHEWFLLIEQEFEALYSQNLALQEKVENLTEQLEQKNTEKSVSSTDGGSKVLISSGAGSVLDAPFFGSSFNALSSSGPGETAATSSTAGSLSVPSSLPPKQPPSSQLKTIKSLSTSSSKSKAAVKLRVQTSKIVSSFKTSPVQCRLIKQYVGHRDGVWDVDAIQKDVLLIGTASADQSAYIWGAECGRVVLQYTGHSGSVNSIRFHPVREVVLTASGDHTAHVWQAAVSHEHLRVQSSEDEVEGSGEEEDDAGCEGSTGRPASLRTPLSELRGHQGVVMAADWLPSGDQVLTASWDRLARIFDVNTGQVISQLSGHVRELTHCRCHPTQRLLATASQDTTFRLYDSRDHRDTVSVFQGHTESVTSVCFTKEDKVVSGSDDRSVKVWDIKNMRSPLASIRLDSPVNRLAVSPSTTTIAIPHDNRQVRLYHLSGQRLARLPHSSRQGHRRMVCAVTWVDECHQQSSLMTSTQLPVTAGSGGPAVSAAGSTVLGGASSTGLRDSISSGMGIPPVGSSKALLFTAGFDRRVFAWEITTLKDKE